MAGDELAITQSYWEIDLGGTTPAKVRNVRFSELRADNSSYQYGGGQGFPIVENVPGNTSMENSSITLERMIDSDAILYTWYTDSKKPGNSPQSQKRDLILTFKNQEGKAVKVFNLKGTFPTAYVPADFDSSTNDVAVERSTITYEYLEIAAG